MHIRCHNWPPLEQVLAFLTDQPPKVPKADKHVRQGTFREVISHLKTEDVCVCRKNLLVEHGLSLRRLQAATVGEKLATLGVGFRRCNSRSIFKYDSCPLTDEALSQELKTLI